MKTLEERRAEKRAYSRRYYVKNRERLLVKQRDYEGQNRDSISARRRKHYAKNHARVMLVRRKYRTKNRERLNTYYRERYRQNREKYRKVYNRDREKVLATKRAYRAKNRKKITACKRRRQNFRYGNCVEFKLQMLLRSRILSALKDFVKSARTEKLLGASVKFVRDYLEAKFLPGMTWENHGRYGWHIDHVNPCASFDLADPSQQAVCFHYTNLQPLWAKDNLQKSAKTV